MNRLLIGAGAPLWGLVVFLGVFWLTFPSSDLITRLQYEVDDNTDGAFAIAIDSASPWWFGLSLGQVIVSSVDKGADPPASQPFLFADNVSARVGLMSVVRRAPVVTSHLRMGEGTIDVVTESAIAEGRTTIQAVDAKGDNVGLNDLISLAMRGAGGGLVADGSLDFAVDVASGDGMRSAKGDARIEGGNMMLQTLSLPSMGIVDLEVNTSIDEVDIRVQVDDGVAEIDKGVIKSSLADLDVSGEVTLNDRISRSRVKLEIVVRLGDWAGTPLEPFQSLITGQMATAKWSDGRYHYTVNTSLDRLDVSDFRAERERSSSSSRSIGSPTIPRTPTPSTTSIDRDDLRARLDARRKERASEASKSIRPETRTMSPPRRDELDEEDLDEGEFDDPDLDDEDLDELDELEDAEDIGDDFDKDY